MKLAVDSKIFELFPELVLGVIEAKKVKNLGEEAKIKSLLRTAETKVRKEFVEGKLGEDERITVWRQAYKKFVCDPHDYRASIEALVRRVVKGDQIRHINNLVDLYNYISLKYVLPVGGEDLDKIQGQVELTIASGSEPFIPLGEDQTDYPKEGEVIYKDTLGVLCRRFNWREDDRTKLTKETKNVLMVIEGLPPAGQKVLQEATGELESLVKEFCGGETESYFLDKQSLLLRNKNNKEVEFD